MSSQRCLFAVISFFWLYIWCMLYKNTTNDIHLYDHVKSKKIQASFSVNCSLDIFQNGMKVIGALETGENITVTLSVSYYNHTIMSDGSDIIAARMFSENDGISFAVQPFNDSNGTFLFNIPKLWKSVFHFEVRILIPSVVTKFMQKYQYDNFYENSWTKYAVYSKNGKETVVECDVTLNTEHYCDLTVYNGMDPWFCQKPKEVSCHDFIFDTNRNPLPTNYERYRMFLTRKFLSKKELVSNLRLSISSGESKFSQIQNQCSFGVDSLPLPSGYFMSNSWKSLRCIHKRFSKEEIKRCVANHHFMFYGDSNAIYFRDTLISILEDQNLVLNQQENKHIYPLLNASTQLHILGHGLGNFPKKGYILKSIDDVLNTPKKHVTVIFISIWAHFTFLSEEKFTNKILYLRAKLRAWKKHYPHVNVFLRSPHFREVQKKEENVLRFNNYNGYQAYKIYKKLFASEPFYFMNLYEMVVAFGGEYDIHPHENIKMENLHYILSRICSN